MSNDTSWQDRYFGGRRRPPQCERSAAMTELMNRRATPHPQLQGRDWEAEARARAENDERERLERLRDLVAQYGIAVVEEVLHGVLPDAVTGRQTVKRTTRKGKQKP